MDIQKIGKFLAQLRREQGMTQEQLGEKLGVTNKTVSRWENGNYLPPVEALQLMSEFYGLTINEILSARRLTPTEYQEKAEENLTDGEVNSGLTYVNNGEAVCVIGIASSAAQYMDSIVHEVMHLAKFIGKAEGLDPYGEEVCYIGGEIGRKMWPKSKLLTSECGCYTKRIDKVL